MINDTLKKVALQYLYVASRNSKRTYVFECSDAAAKINQRCSIRNARRFLSAAASFMATTTRSPASQHWIYFLNGVEQAFNWPKTFILFYSQVFEQYACARVNLTC